MCTQVKPWEFVVEDQTIVCTTMCKAAIAQVVCMGRDDQLDGVEISSKVLERLGEDKGDGSFANMDLVRGCHSPLYLHE